MPSDPLFRLDAEIAKITGMIAGYQQRLKGLQDARALFSAVLPKASISGARGPTSKFPEQILAYLDTVPGRTASRKDIEARLGTSAKVWVGRMVKQGTLIRASHGKYKSPHEEVGTNGAGEVTP